MIKSERTNIVPFEMKYLNNYFSGFNAEMHVIRKVAQDYKGAKLYRKLRFVLVKSPRGNCILASTDLTMDPIRIIEAYAHRQKTLNVPSANSNSRLAVSATISGLRQRIPPGFWMRFSQIIRRWNSLRSLIPACNESSDRACTGIWRLPRGHLPLLAAWGD